MLYNNNDSDEGTRKYRSRTFVPTGHEMDAVRRNKNAYSGRLNEVQLSNVSMSDSSSRVVASASENAMDFESTKSSLLKESAASSTHPYDLSLLIDTDLTSYPAAKVPAVAPTGQ